MHATPIDDVGYARDITTFREPVDRDRCRAWRHAEVLCQITQRERLHLVEMVEELHMAEGDEVAGRRVASVPPVASEIDAGIVAENLCGIVGEAHASPYP